jgi:ornithine cyclodeaminase
MKFVSEATARSLVTIRDAIGVVEEMFLALHRQQAEVFPVVLGHGSDPGSRFSMKSGLIRDQGLVGLKVGTYWPGNRTRGLESHGSTTFFLDDATGAPRALVSASHLTALRTAAADGVAIKHLARPGAVTLGVVGAGHQAWFDVLAAMEVRPIERLLVWSRTAANAERFAQRARDELGLDARAGDLQAVVEAADVLLTVTAASEPLVRRAWVRPGVHISAMGADARGKHELDPQLVGDAALFADVVEQALSIGEYEAAFDAGLIQEASVTPLGAVVAGVRPGRTSPEAITIFDSSGIALQDLAIGAFALAAAERAGQAIDV